MGSRMEGLQYTEQGKKILLIQNQCLFEGVIPQPSCVFSPLRLQANSASLGMEAPMTAASGFMKRGSQPDLSDVNEEETQEEVS